MGVYPFTAFSFLFCTDVGLVTNGVTPFALVFLQLRWVHTNIFFR